MKEGLGADLILTGGKVITVDREFSIAAAVAVKGERILAVGADAEVRAWADAHTRAIDLAGRAVIPGFIDGHAHMDREGLKDVYPSLAGARSIDDVCARIAELARGTKPGEWIVTMPIGEPPYYWDVPGILAEKRFPDRFDLDRAAPDNPVYIRSIWGFWRHTLPLVSIANSAALALAGISRATPDPSPTVTLERDAAGEPTGIFIEETPIPIVELTLMRVAGGFTREQRIAALERSMRAYHAFGTTSVFEEHGIAGEVLAAYKALHATGALTMRCNLVFSPAWQAVAATPVELLLPTWAAWLGGRGMGDSKLRMGGLYTEIDDSVDSRLRAQASPYTGWSGFNYDHGLARDKLKAVLLAAAKNDIRAVAIWPDVLELFKEVDKEIPLAGRRWVFGHVSVLSEADIEAIQRMGLVLTTHTNRHILKEGHLWRERVGQARENDIVPLRRLVDAGIPFGLATDNVPVSMFHPIWHCVARPSRYVAGPVAPEQAITRAEALRAATHGGAHLTFEEDDKGTLEAGKLADLAVLSADPLTCAEEALKDIRAEITVVGGAVVYERK